MGVKDLNYQIVYRGEVLDHSSYPLGQWYSSSAWKSYGGGYWLGRTYPDFYQFGLELPVSLSQGLQYIMASDKVEAESHVFDDDFELYGGCLMNKVMKAVGWAGITTIVLIWLCSFIGGNHLSGPD
ncbi:hypothetical protein [Enterobacter kobei]|uniref:hypothetical protein n=1 Tax=Enterobacter kobei TaxID=208224 RepID=UPI00388F5CDE